MALLDNGLQILTEEECHDLLGRGRVGRVGVTMGALPAIFPVNYAVVDGDVVFFTGDGVKLRAALERAVVAFEVDHIDAAGRTGWSVMLIGLAEDVADPRQLAAVGRLDLRPLAGGDRSHAVRIRPQFISGRRVA
jgi:nitroimidazol reductase NimA-like FMN-containing flavoprotein (pyridoxamine 5'-phosphate oxidase superfamily)